MSSTETCEQCREPAPSGELSEIVEVRSGRVFFVHRPSSTRHCFSRAVGSVYVHRIVTPKAAVE